MRFFFPMEVGLLDGIKSFRNVYNQRRNFTACIWKRYEKRKRLIFAEWDPISVLIDMLDSVRKGMIFLFRIYIMNGYLQYCSHRVYHPD